MKKTILISLITYHLSLITLSSSAAVQQKWTVETSRAQPATFEAYQGETLAFEAALQSSGKPLALSGIAALYWQTNGMGSAYWETTAAVNSNRLSAVWTPEMDVGARVYNCFLGVPGSIYRAAFQLRLRPSPGATPNVLPLPTPVIDFSKVLVLNPPWGSGGGASIDFDEEPTEGSQNAARSGGIWSWVKRLVTGKLAEKRGITDRKNYPETEQVLAERLPIVDNGYTFSNIRVVTDGPFFREGAKYKVCGDVPEYQDITICELDSDGKYIDGSGATFGGVVPTVGMQIACGGATGVSDGDTLALMSDIPAPYTPPKYLRAYDEVRQCWWRGRMVNGVINWEVE